MNQHKEAQLYVTAGQLLRRLTILSSVIARADSAKLERCLKLSPIDRQDPLSLEEARRRLQRLPTHAEISEWLHMADETIAGVISHEEARQLTSVVADSLPLHGRDPVAFVEMGALALVDARLSARSFAVAVIRLLQQRKRAPAICDLIATARDHVDEVKRLRAVLRHAGNIRSNAEAILRRAATPALSASAAPRVAARATAASGSPQC